MLLAECQTTGGYPRIGSVLPVDLPIVAQAQPGVALRFKYVSPNEAVSIERLANVHKQALGQSLCPLVRDPRTMPDLLSFNMIGGVTTGAEDLENCARHAESV